MTDLSHDDLLRFQHMLKDRTGLHFGQDKQRDLSRRLIGAMQAASVASLEAYNRRLWASALDQAVWADLISRLTVGETYFMRNPAHIAALRTHILPPLIERGRSSGHLVLRLWSAGCATGEEPYSLAIILRELLPDVDNWNIMILATDINRKSLTSAVESIFRERSFRNDTPRGLQERYFEPVERGWSLDARVRRMVHFAYLNLVEDSYPAVTSFTAGLDLIVCRNVTIYFDQSTTRQIARRFHAALNDEGWLVVGHSEPLGDIYQGFEALNYPGSVIYRKSSETQSTVERAPSGRTPIDRSRTLPARHPDHMTAPVTPLPPSANNGTHGQLPAHEAEPSTGRITLDDSSAASCYVAGKAFADQMQWRAALEWLERALTLNPLLLEAYFAQGLVYQHEGQDQAALGAFKRVVYIDRTFVLGHFNLGVVYERLGRTKQARRAWSTSHELLQDMAPEEKLSHGDGMTARELSFTLGIYMGAVK